VRKIRRQICLPSCENNHVLIEWLEAELLTKETIGKITRFMLLDEAEYSQT